MEIQRGPREAAVCFQEPPNRKSAWHVYGARLHPSSSLSEKKSCTYPPSRGKSYTQDLQGAEHFLPAHKGSPSQAEKWRPQEKGPRPSVIYTAEIELRNFLISLSSPLLKWWHGAGSTTAVTWPHHITLHLAAQDTHCSGANLRDQATWAQRTQSDFTEQANSQVLYHWWEDVVEGEKGKKKKKELGTAQKLKGGAKVLQLVTAKKTPLMSSLPYAAPHAVGEEIRIGCLASTYGKCSTSILVQAPKGNATAITHLTKNEGCNRLRA